MLVSLMVFLVSLRLCSFFSLCSSDIMISIFVYVDLFSASLNLWLWSSSEFFIPVILLFMPGSLITPQRTLLKLALWQGQNLWRTCCGRTSRSLFTGRLTLWMELCVCWICVSNPYCHPGATIRLLYPPMWIFCNPELGQLGSADVHWLAEST